MITETSKIFVPLAVMAVAAACVYALLNGDHVGTFLFVALGMVALHVAISLATARDSGLPDAPEEAPAVAMVAAPVLPGGWVWPALAASALGLLVLSPLAGVLVGGLGGALGLVAATGWLMRVGGDRSGRVPNMMPIGIPVAGLAAIAALMYLMSRILLAVPEAASTALALVVAVIIMAFATLLVARPSLSSQAIVASLVVGALVMVGGGLVAAQAGEREIEHHGPEAAGHGEGDEAAHAEVEIHAEDLEFDLTQIELPAHAEVTIVFENAEAVLHNFAVYTDSSGSEAIFQGETFTGPQTMSYTFTTPDAGTYHFRCDVHPGIMTGTVKVV